MTAPPTTARVAVQSPDAEQQFSLTLQMHEHYVQTAGFGLDGVAPLLIDEPPPLGTGRGPNPARLLGAAVGSCLGASLLFCLRKARVEVMELRTTVEGSLVRNERGRLRIGGMRVRIEPTVAESDRPRLARCIDLFEDFCVVTQSVRQGIHVTVEVVPQSHHRITGVQEAG